VTGATASSNFPTTPGAADTTYNGSTEVFVTKLNATGSGLLYSTYLGASIDEWGFGIAVDAAGNAYVAGGTYSSDFPTTAGAADTTYNGSRDAFVAKLNASGSGLVYSTFLGGSGEEHAEGVKVDGAGNAYVTGGTFSSDFPTTASAADTTNNGSKDVFVAKFNASGSALACSTYLGGSAYEEAYGIALDAAGNVYVTGRTASSNFPTTAGAVDGTSNGSDDAFVAKLSTGGSVLEYSTYLGGSSSDSGYGIAVDGAGNACVTGRTASSNFPTTAGAVDGTSNGSNDAFVAKLNTSGSVLEYSTYLGGSASDWGHGIAIDLAGNAYVTGYTASSNFPTTASAADTSYNGGGDVFVAKIAGVGQPVPGEIRGTKFDDRDGDGVQDAGEPGLSGWTIYLDRNNNGQLDTGERSTITADDGSYAFTGLIPGAYSVGEVQKEGWVQTLGGWGEGLAEWAVVGDPGNAADTTGYGAVANTFAIGKFEVTNAQYIDFLNAVATTDTFGLWDSQMQHFAGNPIGGIARSGTSGSYTYSALNGDSNWLSRPVVFVNFWDAARYCNWLHNGRPTGNQTAATTEDGAYALDGYTGGDGSSIFHKAGAKFWLPTENEWYKAAYYKGGSTNAGYWDYPTRSDTPPTAELPPGGTNSANFAFAAGAPYNKTSVGAYRFSSSAYGTFDQGGNVYEWNETIVRSSDRGARGGAWFDGAGALSASPPVRGSSNPGGEQPYIGFRLAATLAGIGSVTVAPGQVRTGVDFGNHQLSPPNSAPTIDPVDPSAFHLSGTTVPEGVELSLDGIFVDPDLGDTHTAVIDWGDETTSQAIIDEAANRFAGSHVYADNGSYTVSITLRDSEGAEARVSGERVVFSGVDTANIGMLYVMDAQGGVANRVPTPTPMPNYGQGDAHWSQDGEWITFGWAEHGIGRDEIHVVRADGSELDTLATAYMTHRPSFSPDDKHIAFAQTYGRLCTVDFDGDFDGSVVTVLSPNATHPEWSPVDSNLIVYDNWANGGGYDSDLFTFDLATNTSTLITQRKPGEAYHRASWSHDGRLLVANKRGADGDWDLVVMNADGSGEYSLPDPDGSDQGSGAWLPSGDEIVYTDRGGLWLTKRDATGSPTELPLPAGITASTPHAGIDPRTRITVTNVPPTANDDSYPGAVEDVGFSVIAPGVLTNDTDVPADVLSARPVDWDGAPDGPCTIVTLAGGTVLLSPDGSFTYTPPSNFNGPDSFQYVAWDDDGGKSEAAPVTITVSPVADLTGYKFEDLNANGLWDAGEPPMPGWTIVLEGVGERVTGPDGSYRFDNVPAGQYVLREIVQEGYAPTVPPNGEYLLGVGTADMADLNFGNVLVRRDLSGLVFDDLDNDGVRDAGEAGIDGVAVALCREGTTQVWTTTTSNGELFTFEDLLPATYKLVETQPSGYLEGMETAGTWGGTVDNSQDCNEIRDILFRIGDPDATGYLFAEIRPSRLQGLVWEDFNDDGEVNFGEKAISGVEVRLTGTDDRQNAVDLLMRTDSQGIFEFDIGYEPAPGKYLRPGTYQLTETQPAGYADGQDVVGTVNGVPSGRLDPTQNDRIIDILLARPGADGVNYNFGERPLADGQVQPGQTATIGFWQNKNGQNLVKSLNGGVASTQLGNWLAATFPNMYGNTEPGGVNLAGKTNLWVADFYTSLFKRTAKTSVGGPPKLDAQVLAVAFAVYVTNENLAGQTAAGYGFRVTANGVGYATFDVGSANRAAFDLSATDSTVLTVLDILMRTDAKTRKGILYDLDGNGQINSLETMLRTMANDVYTAINEQGHIA
jgi:formylglycine-generating enzyme required for sulfatase activity